jgi:hypothetical protein
MGFVNWFEIVIACCLNTNGSANKSKKRLSKAYAGMESKDKKKMILNLKELKANYLISKLVDEGNKYSPVKNYL